MITLHYNGTTKSIQEDDSSFRYKAIMGENAITLKFFLNEAIDFPVGTYIEFENVRYTLTSPEKWTRHGNENIEYTMLLEGEQSSLDKYKLRNQQDGRLKFSMNATPAEFLQLIIANLNQTGRETGWTGVCNVVAENKTIEFNHDFISSALTAIVEAFETEYEITDQKVIRLGKVEYNKANPLPLAYGRGNGFKPGTGRANTDDSKPVEILYVQGGERNIDRSTYGSSELHLPKGQQLVYEGTTYEADADGVYIKKAGVTPVYKNEDSFDGSEIYPKRVGTISSVVVKDEGRHFYDFYDTSIPNTLNYNDYLIKGETMTVIFQTGMLAGKEFEISKYVHELDGQPVRRFEIVPQDIDGITMPDNTWKPVAGDTYAIFGCTLPSDYIADNTHQTGAEWDLFKEAARYMHDHSQFKFTFTGELQGKWARENWVEGLAVGSKLVIGGYIRFTDTQFAPSGVDIRIVGVKTMLSDPYAPIIEISNSIASPSTISSDLRKPDAQDVKIDVRYRDSINFTKRRWRDATETMEMLEEAMLENFTSRISPIAINTMQLLVGDESLQFVFVDSKTAPQHDVEHTESWNNQTKVFSMSAGILKHMTLGISDIAGAGTHELSDYKYWSIPANTFNLSASGLSEKSYYLYAKCSKSAETGVFVASETAIPMESVEGYYHFLIGVLNSEYEGDRSFVRLYGFTEILPGRITTDKIVSGSGATFWDLVNNVLNLGGKLQYNTQESGADNLLLKGSLIQTGAGTPTEMSAWCGDYDGTRVYQKGDIVVYTANGVTSTYRYVNSEASSGHLPTDTSYWKVEAAGVQGPPGTSGQSSFKSTAFHRENANSVAAPEGGSFASPLPTTTGWSDGVPDGDAQLWMSTRIFTSDSQAPQQSAWTTPKPVTDTADIDFEFSAVETSPGNPTDNPTNWHDTATANDIWMAVRSCHNGTWGSWEITKIKGEDGQDGRDGESPVVAEMDNDMGGVVLNSNGVLASAVSFETVCKMWFGTQAMTLTAISTSTLPTGFSETHDLATGAVTITIAANTSVPAKTDIALYLTGSYGSSSFQRKLTFIVNGVRNGANGQDGSDGADAVVYSLLPSVSSVLIDKSGNPSSQNVSCKQMKKVGTQAMAETSDCTMKYKLDNGSEQSYTAGTNISYLSFTDTLTFLLYYGTTLIDRETIPKIKDGVDGQDGQDGRDGTDGTDGADGRGISSTVIEYTVDSQGQYAPLSTWQSTIPVVSAGYYLWTRTTITYTDGTTSKSYSVSKAGTNGTDGTNGRDGTDGTNGTNGYSTMYLYKSADEKPTAPTGTSPSPTGWSADPTPAQVTTYISGQQYKGEWVYQSSGTYMYYYKAPAVQDGAASRHSFFFETSGENQYVKFDIAIACEANSDFLLVGKVDETPYYDHDEDDYGNYEYYISSDSSGVMKTLQVVLLVKRAGRHKIDFLYCKDGSVTSNPEAVYFKYNSCYRERKVWMTSCRVQDGVASGWTTPICINGENGANADAAAACVYRGEYNKNPYTGNTEVMTYWGLSSRTDIVKYNGRYYRTNPCVGGSFSGILPTNTAYWMDFGAQFDSVATGFLFAEEAVIENAAIRKLRTSDTGARIVAEGNAMKMLDANGNVKMNIVGSDLGSTPSAASYSLSKTLKSQYYQNFNFRSPRYIDENFNTDIQTFSVSDAANTVSVNNAGCSLTVRTGYIQSGEVTVYVKVTLYLDDEYLDDTFVVFDLGVGDNYQETTLPLGNITRSATVGSHTIKAYTQINVVGSSGYDDGYGYMDFNLSLSGSLAVNYAMQKVEVGANGFRAMFSGNQYAHFLMLNGSPEFLIRNGNIILKVASDGIKKSTNGGTSWTTL